MNSGAETEPAANLTPNRRDWWLAAVVLAGPVLAGALIGGLFFEGALIDEYAYALPAFRLASGGGLRASPTTLAPAFIPILLSAGSTRLLGISMWAARIWSPLILWGTGMIVFGISMKLRAGRLWALAAALAVAAGPVTLPLSGVLMTDIPYSFVVGASAALAIRWWVRRGATTAAACGAAIGIALLIRPQALALLAGCLLAPSIVRFWQLRLRRARDGADAVEVERLAVREAVAFVATVAAGGIALFVLFKLQGGATSSMSHYAKLALAPSPANLLKMTVLFPAYSWLYLAFFLFAPAVALAGRAARGGSFRRLRTPGVIVGLIGGPVLAAILAVFGKAMPYMGWGSIVAVNGIGGGDRPDYPAAFWIGVTVAVALAAAGVGWGLLAAVRGPSRGAESPGPAGEKAAQGESLLLILAAFQVLVAAPLGLTFADSRVGFDRYLIPAVVCVAPVVAARAARLGAKASIALAVSAGVIVLTLLGTQDWITQRRTSWARLDALVDSGVPMDRIDGGFEWDTYHLGEAPPRPDPGTPGGWEISEFAPAIYPEWVLSEDKRDGYVVVETIRWSSWTRSGNLYLMRRQGEVAG